MVLACSSHCLRLTFCFRHFFSTFWLEFCCRKVLPSSPFVCISYRLGIILGTHMLFHRLRDTIHFLKPCPSQPSFLTARSGCWWSLVHRKLFTKQGGPLYMARITVGVTAQQSLEKLGFWHREGFEDTVDRVQGLQGHTCRETDCSSDRRNWLQLRESLVVLLWETLRPICLYSPLSFFSLFLSNALSWVRNSCLQACFRWAVRIEECWVDRYRGTPYPRTWSCRHRSNPLPFFYPEYTLGERPSLLTKVSHSTPRKQSCFERLGFHPCHWAVSYRFTEGTSYYC